MSEATLFDGYAATYALDYGGDAIAPGAFRGTLPEFRRRGLLCWSHDLSRPVGMVRLASEDEQGLRIFWQWHSHPDGEAARIVVTERMAAKLDTGLSIGYRVRKAEPGPGGTRRLLALDLLEVSVVALPMNPAANITLPKGLLIGPPVSLLESPWQRFVDRAMADNERALLVLRARRTGVTV